MKGCAGWLGTVQFVCRGERIAAIYSEENDETMPERI